MPHSEHKIISAGHICLDITPHFAKTETRTMAEMMLPGQLINMEGVTVRAGGSVANTGLALYKLGNQVSLICKTGQDAFGEMIATLLQQPQVSLHRSMSDCAPTSYSIVMTPPGTDRIFLHDAGANREFCKSDIDLQELEGASIFHLGYPPLMQMLYQEDGNHLVEIFKQAKQKNLLTSLDMAAIDPHSTVGRVNWQTILQKVVPLVDYFMPSVEELAFMIDRPLYDAWVEKAHHQDVIAAINIEQDLPRLGAQLMAFGAHHVLIKCGETGIYFKDHQLELFEESFQPRQVVCTTGAGDTAIAGFLTGIAQNATINDCLKLACAVGAICVESFDVFEQLPPVNEIFAHMKDGWQKQRITLGGQWQYDPDQQCWYRDET